MSRAQMLKNNLNTRFESKIKHTSHNYAYNIQHTAQSVQCTAKESEHTVPGIQGGTAAGGEALKIRRGAQLRTKQSCRATGVHSQPSKVSAQLH